MNRLRMIRVGRKLFAEELQADSLKRLERLTTNTPMAPVDKTPARAEGCGVAMTIGRDVFDEVITERDALRQQLAETRDELEANRLFNRFAWKDRACKAEQQVATLAEALEKIRDEMREWWSPHNQPCDRYNPTDDDNGCSLCGYIEHSHHMRKWADRIAALAATRGEM